MAKVNVKQALKELASKARTLSEMTSDDDVILSEIESYVEALDGQKWLAALGAQGGAEAALNQLLDEETANALQEFADIHAAVIEKALSLQGEVAVQLRKQKRKGKGILAYEKMTQPVRKLLHPRKG